MLPGAKVRRNESSSYHIIQCVLCIGCCARYNHTKHLLHDHIRGGVLSSNRQPTHVPMRKNRKRTALNKAHYDEFWCEYKAFQAQISYTFNKQSCNILSLISTVQAWQCAGGDASPHGLTPLDPPLRVAVVRSVALIIVVGRLLSIARNYVTRLDYAGLLRPPPSCPVC